MSRGAGLRPRYDGEQPDSSYARAMSTTPPEDIDDLFGLEPVPDASPSAEQAAAAAAAAAAQEAALAAELEAVIASGGVSGDAPDSRTDHRVKVSWPARMQLPDGRVVELQVRDISHGGVGLMSGEQIPARTIVNFEMDVPRPDAGGSSTPVKGVVKTTYTVAEGSGVRGGASWEDPPAGLELVSVWIKRLRA